MPTHGKASTYRHGCRCDECRTEHTKQVARESAGRARRPVADVPHGLSGYKNWGCRCEVCSHAHTNYRVGEWDASRTGFSYTDVDLELLNRADLTVSEIAKELRRSYRSVVLKRYELRRSA